MKTVGVYQIKNSLNGKVYVGSSIDIQKRTTEHKKLLRDGKHKSPHLQNAWHSYGEGVFAFSVLVICRKSELLLYEQAAIDALAAHYSQGGYNMCARAYSPFGRPTTERMKAALKGRKNPVLREMLLTPERQKKSGDILKRCWADPEFYDRWRAARDKALDDPAVRNRIREARRRRAVRVVLNGFEMVLAEAAKVLGVSRRTVYHAHRLGVSYQEHIDRLAARALSQTSLAPGSALSALVQPPQ